MSLRSHTALLSDPAAIRRQFPLLTREGLHYLDSAATAQMPEAVIAALQKFGTSLRANVYGGVYKLAQEALAEYEAARADVARFLGAVSPQEVVLTYGTTSSLNFWPSPSANAFERETRSSSPFSSITATLCPGAHSHGAGERTSASCR